jgi:hypothetical protein
MQGVCEFIVSYSRQQAGLDATKVFTHLEQNVPKRRDGGIDSTGCTVVNRRVSEKTNLILIM